MGPVPSDPLSTGQHTHHRDGSARRGTRHPRGEALNSLTPGLIHELHQAAFYLPPDPHAPGEAVPVLALAGFRIAAHFTEDGSLSIEVNGEEAAPLFPRDADGKLAVTVHTDSSISQT